ncbi:hypothetical protein E2C01_050240 [Portunus trituberculatus]|uniref:Uncharacterized protein n=1 Tax=Portunus trituberculatus TaxID=210409 RepID=A0A5B7GG67_PORTR|nr:hypothetical protein [Portunus trituberculatus]
MVLLWHGRSERSWSHPTRRAKMSYSASQTLVTAECEEKGGWGPLGSQPFSSGRAAGVCGRGVCAAGLPETWEVLHRACDRRRV